MTVARTGNAHDSSFVAGNYASASYIRKQILAEETSYNDLIPSPAVSSLTAYLAEHVPLSADDFSFPLALALMKACSADELASFKNVTPALAKTIFNSRDSFVTFTQFAELVKSKSLTRTAVNRALLSIALGLTSSSSPDDSGLFAHVLGFREQARPLLSALTSVSKIPVIIRPSRETSLPPSFLRETELSDLYNLVRAQKEKKPLVRTMSHRLLTV